MNFVRLSFVLCVLLMVGCSRVDTINDPTESLFSNRRVRQLVIAAETGNAAKIDQLVADGVDVNATGRGNTTPLLRSLYKQNRDGYLALLKHGADPNHRDHVGHAVMHEAAELADPFWIEQALKFGGDPNRLNTGNQFSPGWTPLYYAINYGRTQNVRLLIAAGADIDHQDGSSYPIHYAFENNAWDIIYLLLEQGADYSPPNKDYGDLVEILRDHYRMNLIEHVERHGQRQWFDKVTEFIEAEGHQVR